MTDGRGNLRLRFLIGNRNYRWQYRLADENKWRPLHEREHAQIDDHYEPVGFGDDPSLLLVLKPHEGRLALWSEDLCKGPRKKPGAAPRNYRSYSPMILMRMRLGRRPSNSP